MKKSFLVVAFAGVPPFAQVIIAARNDIALVINAAVLMSAPIITHRTEYAAAAYHACAATASQTSAGICYIAIAGEGVANVRTLAQAFTKRAESATLLPPAERYGLKKRPMQYVYLLQRINGGDHADEWTTRSEIGQLANVDNSIGALRITFILDQLSSSH